MNIQVFQKLPLQLTLEKVRNNIDKVQQLMGVCPQFDILVLFGKIGTSDVSIVA